jgi:hypothetical protein
VAQGHLWEKRFPPVTEMQWVQTRQTLLTSVFGYIYAVSKWHVDCGLRTRIIACQALSDVPGRERKTTIGVGGPIG